LFSHIYGVEEIDLPERLKANKPDFDHSLQRFQYVASLPDTIGMRHPNLVLNGYSPINTQTLRRAVGEHADLYLKWLVDHGVFDMDERGYFPGERSTGYRLQQEFGNLDTARIELSGDAKLVKKLSKGNRFQFQMALKYEWLYGWLGSNQLKVDFDGAETALLRRYDEDMAAYLMNDNDNPFTPNPWSDCNDIQSHPIYRLRQGRMALKYVRDGGYPPFVDTTGYRLHSAITILPRVCRPFVKWGSDILQSVDVRNSQPFFLLRLFDPAFYTTTIAGNLFTKASRMDAVSWLREGGITESITAAMSRCGESCDTGCNPHERQDFAHFRLHVCGGVLYDWLQDETNAVFGYKPNRDAMKKSVMLTLFSSNKFMGGKCAAPKRLFRDLLPFVFGLTKILKKDDHVALAIALQQLESKTMLDHVCKRLKHADPDRPLLTLHDSGVVPQGAEKDVAAVMEEEAFKVVGYTPTVAIEPWIPKPASSSVLSFSA
jgi:hypothetical protein